ncbi:MAG: TLP18.3, Psb32 and MOLO-1 founding proteins of phosphatase-domain-containing protein [Monoraphidium minutum]|nr:MAG: TLP18.3, Psb32 and MOLO-1 founding proteins of phosphatase-domain-containing protein [Monoraphidium minutum]
MLLARTAPVQPAGSQQRRAQVARSLTAGRAQCISRAAEQRGQQQARVAPLPLQRAAAFAAAGFLGASMLLPGAALARLDPVNRPDLLPKEFTTVIDVAGFLAPSEEKRIAAEVESLERDTGIKLRVLAQNYPETPGLAVRDYWSVDDNTVVFVADPTFANLVNINVGAGLDLEVPQSFWSRLAGKYGNKFYWQGKGEATAITNTVSAIDTCLREPPGRQKCAIVQGEFEEEPKAGGFKLF